MKRIIAIFCAACMLCTALWAAPRSRTQAAALAKEYFQENTVLTSSTNHKQIRKAASLSLAYEAPSYYAFNSGEGFVLVSADDRMEPILGYSDAGGSFCYDSLPDAMRYWLACYDEALERIDSENLVLPQKATAATVTAVGPLLTSKWNQSAPYNNQTPVFTENRRAATGCVATAMAQIMYYWKYPEHGTGSHEYTWINSWDSIPRTLSADFASATYEWNNMVDKATASSPAAVQNAVSLLMLHCGISSDMNYASDHQSYSGTQQWRAAQALKDYFGYDSNLKRAVYRSNYTDDDFKDLIRNEIDAGRPILYAGWTEDGKSGHSFVCDGYNSQGLFHINWGWGGSSDGWFMIELMNPSEQGIGGSTGRYSKSQQIAIGIQPPRTYSQLGMDSLSVSATSISRTAGFSATIHKLRNYGITSFSGSYGFALYDEDGTNRLQVLKSTTLSGFAAYATADKTLASITIPSSIANGYYRLYAVFKDNGGDWHELSAKEADDYIMLQLTDDKIEIYSSDEEADVALTEKIHFADNDSVPHSNALLHYAIYNSGGRLDGYLRAVLYKGVSQRGAMSEEVPITVNKNQLKVGTINCNISSATASGKYVVRLQYKTQDGTWTELAPTGNNRLSFTLVDDVPEDIDLQLTRTPSFADNASVPYTGAQLSYEIVNKGVYYDGEIGAFIYAGSLLKDTVGIEVLDLNYKDTLRATFTHNIKSSIAEGTYTLRMRYRQYGSSVWVDMEPDTYSSFYFTLQEPQTRYTTVEASICEGNAYSWHNNDYMEAGEYVWTGTAVNGADSIVTLVLTVNPVQSVTIERSICAGGSYTFHEKDYSEAGTYTWTGTNQYGCDSTETLVLTVNPVQSVTIERSICAGGSYTFHEKDYSEAGTYTWTGTNQYGCDSTETLVLTVNPVQAVTIEKSICAGGSYTFHEKDYSETGTYTWTGTNQYGCDSTETLVLTINPAYAETVEDSICEGESYWFNDREYKYAGTYKRTLKNELGCDSVVTLSLKVLPRTTQVITRTIDIGDLPWTDGVVTIPADYTSDLFETSVSLSAEEQCAILEYHVTIDPGTETLLNDNAAEDNVIIQQAGNVLRLHTEKPVSLQLYSADGKLLQALNTLDSDSQIVLPSKGIYMLRFQSKTEVEVRKIVIQ